MPWGLAGRGEGTQGTERGSLLLGRELGLRGVPPGGRAAEAGKVAVLAVLVRVLRRR